MVSRHGEDQRSWADRLTAKAAALARAAAETRLRARRADPARWRKAGLLWPLFAPIRPENR